MWEKIFEIFQKFFTIGNELQRLQADSKQHSEEIRALFAGQTRLHYESQLQRERDARERERGYEERERSLLRQENELLRREYKLLHQENELLRQENQQLRERLARLEQRSLPPAPPDKKPDEE